MHTLASVLAIVLSSVTIYVNGYGHQGHFILGESAWAGLSQSTQTFLAPWLIKGSLGTSSVWADVIKYKGEYAWTRPVHYYDTDDNPPMACAMPKSVDNSEPNIFSALTNFTNNLKMDLSEKDFKFNLYMAVHLIEDLHQPLHLSGKARGGNSVHIYLDRLNKTVSLHEYYDVQVIHFIVMDSFSGDPKKLIQHLHEKSMTSSCAEDPFTFWEYARSIEKMNCDFVWQTPFDEEYIKKSQEQVLGLMEKGTTSLKCYLETMISQEVFKNKVRGHESL
jgi:hypothetical protein